MKDTARGVRGALIGAAVQRKNQQTPTISRKRPSESDGKVWFALAHRARSRPFPPPPPRSGPTFILPGLGPPAKLAALLFCSPSWGLRGDAQAMAPPPKAFNGTADISRTVEALRAASRTSLRVSQPR
jgi:hypothetical protein